MFRKKLLGEDIFQRQAFFNVVLNGGCNVRLDDSVQVEDYELLRGEGLQFPSNMWMVSSDFN